MKNKFCVYTFYHFLELKNIERLKIELDQFLSKTIVKGTILISNEGINGSLSATKEDLDVIVKFIKDNLLNTSELNVKINNTTFLPFNKMKVRLKKEIVSLGKGNLDIKKNRGIPIPPEDWNRVLKEKNTKVIDVRNKFEIDIGKFNSSINPNTNSFREFPDNFKKLKLDKNTKIAMYCTGGIRCEKASTFLKSEGFNKVYQLDGGIINYLDKFKYKTRNSQWNGECFVFDNRVTVNQKLNKGKFEQCYGCRHPITKKDMKSKKYKKGVYCPFCFNKRTQNQIKSSEDRQRHIEKYLRENKNIYQ